MATLTVMSEPDRLVALQIPVRKSTRKRLKNVAIDDEVTMAVLGDLLLDYGLSLVESGKIPPALNAMLTKAQEDARKDRGE